MVFWRDLAASPLARRASSAMELLKCNPVHTKVGLLMNKRGMVSVKALTEALPLKTLQYLAIFGSQVRGDARPDSDLDVLFVGHIDLYHTIRNAILNVPDGVDMVTIIPHTSDTIRKSCNTYGSIEWCVLRGKDARTLYQSADFDITPHTEVDCEYSAKWRGTP